MAAAQSDSQVNVDCMLNVALLLMNVALDVCAALVLLLVLHCAVVVLLHCVALCCCVLRYVSCSCNTL